MDIEEEIVPLDLNLKGKVGIVTGAGRGIGEAIAVTLGEEGACVVVNDIDGRAASEVSRRIVFSGTRSIAIEADVTKPEQVEEMVKTTIAEFGTVDLLVNNAGIVYEAGSPISRKPFVQLRFEDWQKEIDLILYGTLNCIKAVIDHMIERRYGRIVNISSDLGRASTGTKGYSIYSAAKGGVIALTRSIAAEVAPHGITVNAVCPGLVRTTRARLAELRKETDPEGYEWYRNLERTVVNTIPLGRIGEPEEIAKLAVFLASDASSWITGQCFVANGGAVMV